MEGKIVIELTLPHTPESGSGLPDLAHTGYWLKKQLAELEYKDANGKMRRLLDDYAVSKVMVQVT